MNETASRRPSPMLDVRGLKKWFDASENPFGTSRLHVHAVEDMSFHVGDGETVGLVGESGSGKTTVGRCILRLMDPTSGEILFQGRDIARLPERALKSFRRQAQPIFQIGRASCRERVRIWV